MCFVKLLNYIVMVLSSLIIILIFNCFNVFYSLGELSAVDNLSYSFIHFSMVNISWKPPYTLPGTAITGYNLSVSSNGTTTDYFTSDSDYELQLNDITDSPCDEINATVSGFNGLNGETTSIFGLYLPSGTFIQLTINNL